MLGSRGDEKKPPRFQLHLSTCLILMLVIGLFMPLVARLIHAWQTYAELMGDEFWGAYLLLPAVLTALALATLLVFLVGVALLCERWIRHGPVILRLWKKTGAGKAGDAKGSL